MRTPESDYARLVTVAVDHTVRGLCGAPYHGHPKGCPNLGKKLACPPHAPLIEDVLDLQEPVWAVFNIFDFAFHLTLMQQKHPFWTQRQLACCLYWQPRARERLREKIHWFLRDSSSAGRDHRLQIVGTPEACGVNITDTMASAGLELEWPPRTLAYQVVLAGIPAAKEN